jgi:hypothetical protein
VSVARIAEILGVDEVNLMHGPRGVALYVRVGSTWQSTTVDNDDLGTGDHRRQALTKSLVSIADGLNKSLGRGADLRKASAGATLAAVEADRAAERNRRWLAGDVGIPYGGGFQRQVQREEPAPTPAPPTLPSAGPAVSEPMPSRFHAIMAELGDL